MVAALAFPPRAAAGYRNNVSTRLRQASALLALWTVPAFIAATQAWFALGGPSGSAPFFGLLLAQLPSWYLWAAATPVVLLLARRWTPTARSYAWVAPHLAVAASFTIFRTVSALLYLLPFEGLPITLANIARGLRGNLPFGFLLDILVYGVILAFGAVALRERAEAAPRGGE